MARQIQTARQGTTDFSARDLRALDTAIDGVVLAPGDAGWDEARLAWNLAVERGVGGAHAAQRGSSTAGSPSMLTPFFSRW
jgi:hypothetical protein